MYLLHLRHVLLFECAFLNELLNFLSLLSSFGIQLDANICSYYEATARSLLANLTQTLEAKNLSNSLPEH